MQQKDSFISYTKFKYPIARNEHLWNYFLLLLSFGLSGMSVIVSSGELIYVLICNWKNDLMYKVITI